MIRRHWVIVRLLLEVYLHFVGVSKRNHMLVAWGWVEPRGGKPTLDYLIFLLEGEDGSSARCGVLRHGDCRRDIRGERGGGRREEEEEKKMREVVKL